jgi:hypothetical protein
MPSSAGRFRECGKEKLLEFVKNHTHDESQPEVVVHEGAAADSILSFAQAGKADLIVMGTHGRRGFDRVVLGSVTERVMRMAPCPVLAISRLPHEVMAAGEERRRVHHLNRILFCADFSEASERGFELCALRDGGVRRRAHPAARVGGSTQSGQDGRRHRDSHAATRYTDSTGGTEDPQD